MSNKALVVKEEAPLHLSEDERGMTQQHYLQDHLSALALEVSRQTPAVEGLDLDILPGKSVTQTVCFSFECSISFNIVVERDVPGFHAYVPAMQGLHVGGDTVEEAWKRAHEAIAAYASSARRRNHPIATCPQEVEMKTKQAYETRFSVSVD